MPRADGERGDDEQRVARRDQTLAATGTRSSRATPTRSATGTSQVRLLVKIAERDERAEAVHREADAVEIEQAGEPEIDLPGNATKNSDVTSEQDEALDDRVGEPPAARRDRPAAIGGKAEGSVSVNLELRGGFLIARRRARRSCVSAGISGGMV